MRRKMHIFDIDGTLGERIPRAHARNGWRLSLAMETAEATPGSRETNSVAATPGGNLPVASLHGMRAFRFHAGQQRRPMPQQGRVAAQSRYRGPLIAIQGDCAGAVERAARPFPSGGV
jgi:phosphoserine phosphatase